MALAPRLEFRQSQQLVMTPQLQQAIKLLQLSNLELAEYVDDQLEQNPFLERDETPTDGPAERRGEKSAETEGPAEAGAVDQTDAKEARDSLDVEYEDIDPSGTGSDAAYGDYRPNDWTSASSGRGFDGDDQEFGATLKKEISLADHLTEQLHMATRDPMQLFIGAYVIDMIDEAGYLREDLLAIAERLGAELADVEATHAMITKFDPSGVGARDLKECLKLQLIDANRFDPSMQAFVENIELLARNDLKGLMKATDADEEDVRDMIAEVRALTPKPGYAYGGGVVQAIAPDVFVTKSADGGWKVELNSETLPRILVNQRYYAEISSVNGADEKDKMFMAEHFSNANWLAKSLHQRAQTILKVSSEIVRQQDAFLAFGVKHLRPLNLKVVADAIEMHESTVSRVTSNKYIATPRGLFELKYFFTASIASSSGGDAHSAEAVRHRIREMIEAETKDTVLSDDKIVDILREEGVDIARRTVAKYRETLNIPSSVQRRRAMLQTAI
ncbi:RNA polymerase factor sigma-54 [Hyphococcus sp.]|uniref:RNA polymerase factor sigma-54 n=1 Tax=Hyphococcus sp. TaxID=2038636 RepID=UPI00208812AC|nr:MAG: RNA polymerase sigma-54 factor 2 [Marinicaulis sp.]